MGLGTVSVRRVRRAGLFRGLRSEGGVVRRWRGGGVGKQECSIRAVKGGGVGRQGRHGEGADHAAQGGGIVLGILGEGGLYADIAAGPADAGEGLIIALAVEIGNVNLPILAGLGQGDLLDVRGGIRQRRLHNCGQSENHRHERNNGEEKAPRMRWRKAIKFHSPHLILLL